ncbi:hypothetical protein [Rhodanobacter lindaniclasticus]
MSDKHRLRVQRAGTVINLTSKQQEKALGKALAGVCGLKEVFRHSFAASSGMVVARGRCGYAQQVSGC